MKSHLTKVSLAFVSALFILGCQDLGTSVEASDGLGPQFAKGGKKGKPDKPGGGGGGGGGSGNTEAFELDLAGGMLVTGLDVDGQGSIVLQSNNFPEVIKVDFRLYEIGECEIIRGTDGVHHAPTIELEHETRLLEELDLTTVTNGTFGMDIDLTGLEPPDVTSTPHFLEVNYDNEFGKRSVVALLGGGTVTWVSSIGSVDVFKLAGPVTVAIRGVTGGKGKKSNRTIRCGGADDNVVTATVRG